IVLTETPEAVPQAPDTHIRWNIIERILGSDNLVNTTITVTTDLTPTPAPAISADRIVWQQASAPGLAQSGPDAPNLSGSNVWGNVNVNAATPTPTYCPFSFNDVHPEDYFYE